MDEQIPPWEAPKDANGGIDWHAMLGALPQRDPIPDFGFGTAKEREAKEQHQAQVLEKLARIEEAKAKQAELKSGVPIPPPMAPMDSIQLEFAMKSDTATVDLKYLVDPFLPSGCVVGFFGRGSTAKSSFVATMGADISGEASTLWISVEEPADWIKVRHMKAGGHEGTLMVFIALAKKTDSHGRVIGSSFDVYEHLEPAITKAKQACEQVYNPPRPLRLVVLDTAVGLTGWRPGR